MSKITLVGLDTSKSVFHLVAVDEHGQVSWRRCLRRAQLLSFFAQLPVTRVVLEACGGSHHWGHFGDLPPQGRSIGCADRQQRATLTPTASPPTGEEPLDLCAPASPAPCTGGTAERTALFRASCDTTFSLM